MSWDDCAKKMQEITGVRTGIKFGSEAFVVGQEWVMDEELCFGRDREGDWHLWIAHNDGRTTPIQKDNLMDVCTYMSDNKKNCLQGKMRLIEAAQMISDSGKTVSWILKETDIWPPPFLVEYGEGKT